MRIVTPDRNFICFLKNIISLMVLSELGLVKQLSYEGRDLISECTIKWGKYFRLDSDSEY